MRWGRSGARALAVTPMGTQMAQRLSDRCGHYDGFSDGYPDGSLPPLMGWSGVNAQMGIQMGGGPFLRFAGVRALEPLRWGELPRWGLFIGFLRLITHALCDISDVVADSNCNDRDCAA